MLRGYLIGAVLAITILFILVVLTIAINIIDASRDKLANSVSASTGVDVSQIRVTTYSTTTDAIWSRFLFWLPAFVIVGAAAVYSMHMPRR